MRPPELLKATTGDVFHCEEAADASRRFNSVGVENAHDIRVAEPGQQDRLVEHSFGFLKAHAGHLEDLHRLPTKKTMSYPIHLGERALTKVPFDLVSPA